ncbi:MAG: hypothetical protein ACWA41_08265 [Putridiphycobacter sp.]
MNLLLVLFLLTVSFLNNTGSSTVKSKEEYSNVYENGKSTKGEVKEIVIDKSFEAQGKYIYIIDYSYMNNGKIKDDRFATYLNIGSLNLIKGDKVNVKFTESKSILPDFKIYVTSNLFHYIETFIMLLISFTLLFYMFSFIKKNKRLYKNGLKTKGNLRSIKSNHSILSNFKANTIVVYSYCVNGYEYTDKDFIFYDDVLIGKTIGDEIEVVLDNENTKTSRINII